MTHEDAAWWAKVRPTFQVADKRGKCGLPELWPSEIKPELGEGEDAPSSGIISRFVVVAKWDKCWVLSLRGLSMANILNYSYRY